MCLKCVWVLFFWGGLLLMIARQSGRKTPVHIYAARSRRDIAVTN